NLAVKKDEWTAYSDKVKSDLEVPAKRHMKSVEVPTGEKSMFGLGKEIMKTEKKPTKNVVISERDYKNIFGWFLFCFHYFFTQTKHGLFTRWHFNTFHVLKCQRVKSPCLVWEKK